jgi:hypothetical protein
VPCLHGTTTSLLGPSTANGTVACLCAMTGQARPMARWHAFVLCRTKHDPRDITSDHMRTQHYYVKNDHYHNFIHVK